MPNDPEATFGCLISEDAAKNVEKQVKDTIAAGANLVFGGRRKGAFYEPTILDNVTKIWMLLRIWKYLVQLYQLLSLKI